MHIQSSSKLANHTLSVGRIVGLWRYPVKSMGAEALDNVDVSWFGLAGDRRWAFVRDEALHSDFPWLTIRERNDMHLYMPTLTEPERPDKSPATITTPLGKIYAVTDPELGEELYPSGVHPIKQQRGIFDTFPISIITTQTIDALEKMVGMPLAVQRFRPNLLIELTDNEPFAEDAWVGRELRIGDMKLRVDKRDQRCAIITVDPNTSNRQPDILRAVVNERQSCLGVYGTTVKPGSIALNDEAFIE